ncbi:Cys-tRNA(Pro) deacylase [Pseudoalteromonas luteoviolacea]|uniref:Cys-tRNA(Pro) deacylase n=1 Tax=Pseudoalteromonas luteoviolacea TaxID=43657 RepID=UPI001B39C6CA|nr:Cys-tRNA(Pro) deacylase [Pseudoalteromonas luteoviolacea]MBQ4810709.1 Cys-tRNA(Pro) deacylase [Pseudoalteromonas luteoviolacea]
MTPAINLLRKQKVAFEVLKFKHDPSLTNYAQEAATKLNLDHHQVFKTLVIDVDGELIIGITPANQQVDLKSFAKSICGKKAQMADKNRAQTATGYLLGGISPFAHKKNIPVVLHETAKQYPNIYVSGGRRGLEISICPDILIAITKAKLATF